MDKTYRPYDPEQLFLLPPSLRDWLPEDHLVHFLSDLVDELDLSTIIAVYEQEARGYPPYHPRMMVKLLLYAYTLGVPSSRKIAQRYQEDVAFRVLTGNNTPDFRTISDFRKRHLAALQGLFLVGDHVLLAVHIPEAGAFAAGQVQRALQQRVVAPARSRTADQVLLGCLEELLRFHGPRGFPRRQREVVQGREFSPADHDPSGKP